MAERAPDRGAGPGPYRAIVASRFRAQVAYRRSFAFDVVGSVGTGLLEFAAVYVIFTSIDALGGLDLAGVALVFGLANLAFGLADLLVGHLDRIPHYVRTGTLDALLLRPLPVLPQLVTEDVQLRRVGRASMALVVLVVAMLANPIELTPATVGLVVMTAVSGTAIFCALWVAAAGLQFWLLDAGELVNSFTYGSGYAASYPTSIFTTPLRVLFTFVIPAAFIAYLPALLILDLPGPAWTPAWLGWLTPVAAVVVWALALALWRAGLRHYTGAGS